MIKITDVDERILEEAGITNSPLEDEARRVLKRSQSYRDLEDYFDDRKAA